jgi:hypothetical protein
MAPLKSVHKTEAALAKELLEPFRTLGGNIQISRKRADVLEQLICEALVQSFCAGMEAP